MDTIGQDDQDAPLFNHDDLFHLTLVGDVQSLFDDRTGKAEYFPFQIRHANQKGDTLWYPLRVKTRGKFRRIATNCKIPPLLLNFKPSEIPELSVFRGQNKLKLVTACRDEKYVVREYLAYQIFNEITNQSFKARLVKVTFEDLAKGVISDPLFGVILEDEDALAARLGGELVKQDLIRPNHLDKENFLQFAFYEFMIGNTDWSVQYRQNIKLIQLEDGTKLIGVPYDFDHAGLVRAPYAQPAPELQMTAVTQRRYRGYCMNDLSVFEPIINQFAEKRDVIMELIQDHRHLDKSSKKFCGKFVEQFFDLLEKEKQLNNHLKYPCLESGTGNVVIQGLPKN